MPPLAEICNTNEATALTKQICDAKFRWQTEADLQDRIAELLAKDGIPFIREARLSGRDRPDFMVGNIAIEVKVNDGFAPVLRQIHRYAQLDQVAAIIVVTSKACHRQLPGVLNGKPVHVVFLWGGMF